MGYTEEELAGLTDEEREVAEQLAAEEAAAKAGDDNGDDNGSDDKDDADAKGKDEGGGEGEGDKEPEGKDDEQPAGDDEGKKDEQDDEGKKDDDPAPAATAADTAAPVLVAEAPADADAKLKEIEDQKSALIDKFDDGEITAKEYQSQLDALNKQQREIEFAVQKAQLAQEMNEQQRVNTWLAQVREFTTKEHPEYSTSKFRWVALDTAVKEIGSDPANANLSGAEILEQAHARVVADLGEAPSNATAKESDGKKRPLKGPKAEPPPTLAKVPAADPNGIEDGKFAVIDRLMAEDPEAAEERLMRMSAEDRDAFLARQ